MRWRRRGPSSRGRAGVIRPRPALFLTRFKPCSATGWGCSARARPPESLDELALTPVRLAPGLAAGLSALVGEAHAAADHETRARHALGKSTLDLLAVRGGGPLPAPDLVLFPGSHEEVLAVLVRCAESQVAVVPFGGGTSVVGGLTPEADRLRGLVALDLRRLNQLIELDRESRLARLEPGLRGPEAEALLGAEGYTIGHFPQSFEYATLGGFAAARSSGQASAGYGRFDDLVMGMRVATPSGTLELGRAPKAAAGPDLRQLILGSEGALGVITELTVQVRPVPAARRYDGWRFASFAQGTAVLRRLAQDGPRPTVLRLSDEAETALGLARPDQLGAGDTAGGESAVRPGQPGHRWLRGHGGGGAGRSPRIRDRAARGRRHPGARSWPGLVLRALSRPLSAGRAPRCRRPRGDARDGRVLVSAARALSRRQFRPAGVTDQPGHSGRWCSVTSHTSTRLEPRCTSLSPALSARTPIAQWREAKAAAMTAIQAAGGSISHHHGVGRDHRSWLPGEIGELGVAALAAVKRELDPTGVLNPGILITSS